MFFCIDDLFHIIPELKQALTTFVCNISVGALFLLVCLGFYWHPSRPRATHNNQGDSNLANHGGHKFLSQKFFRCALHPILICFIASLINLHLPSNLPIYIMDLPRTSLIMICALSTIFLSITVATAPIFSF